MKKLIAVLIVSLISSALLLAHGEEKTGILVHSACAEELEKDPSKVESHPIACSKEGKKGGYGIISEGKFYHFDDYGNKQARLLLKVTEKKENLKLRVGGHFEGTLIKVCEMETVD